MEQLQKQVQRARRRLTLQRLLATVTWSVFAALLVAVVALVVPKIWAMGLSPAGAIAWTLGWIGGSVAAGLIVAIIWSFVTRRSALEAAIEIDHRYELRERVSSTLALSPGELETEAGRALLDDAVRRVRRIDVGERFHVRANWRMALPLLPAVLLFVLAVFVHNAVRPQQTEASETAIAIEKQIKKSSEVLKKEIAQRSKKADDLGLKEAGDLFKRIEQGVDEMAGKEGVDRKKAMVDLNDLAKEVKKRRQAVGGSDEIRKQLNQLKNMKKGPADDVTKALKEGDFKKALDEIENLKDKLQKNDLTDEEKANLADQLDQMKNKLDNLAQAHEQAKQDLKQQIEQAKNDGDQAKAEQLQQQRDRLSQQNQQMDRLQQMANKLGQCSNCMKQGNAQDAAKQLDQMASDLQSMQQEIDEMEMLDDALDQISQAKDRMNCGNCGGEGCEQCGGQGMGAGKDDKMAERPGPGGGDGKGMGFRPEEKTDTSAYDSRVRAKPGEGKAVVVGEVPGPNKAGEAREEIKSAMESAKRESAKPLTDQHLPRAQREHARQYFDALHGKKDE